MTYIKLTNQEKKYYSGSISPISLHVIEVKGLPKAENGLYLYGNNDILLGDYSSFSYLYRIVDDNTYQYSDDGSVYTKPKRTVIFKTSDGGVLQGILTQSASNYNELQVPTPIPNENNEFGCWTPEIPTSGDIERNRAFIANFFYVPTLEEEKKAKIDEMNTIQQDIIQSGINVTLSDGTIEHFTLRDHDQISLAGLQLQVAAGLQQIPWHVSDNSVHCKYYSPEDMSLIINTATFFLTYHVTYFRDLRIYIQSLQTKEEVQNIVYGVEIPEQYQSIVLKDLLLQLNNNQ